MTIYTAGEIRRMVNSRTMKKETEFIPKSEVEKLKEEMEGLEAMNILAESRIHSLREEIRQLKKKEE